MSETSETDAIRTGESVRNVRCVLDTGRTDTPDTGSARLVSDTFSVNPKTGVWIERAGQTTRGTRPAYLDWPMVRGDEFAPQSPQAPKVRR